MAGQDPVLVVGAFIIALGATIALALCAVRDFKGEHEFITPWIGLSFFAIADIFVPAMSATLFGWQPHAPWVGRLDHDEIAVAVPTYAFSFALLGAGYWLTVRKSRGRSILDRLRTSTLRPFRGNLVWTCSLVVAIYSLAFSARNARSVQTFVQARLVLRWVPIPAKIETIGQLFLVRFTPVALPVLWSVTVLLFFYRKRLGRPWLWGMGFPAVSWLFTLTTFFRGTQLNFFASFALAESVRIRLEREGLSDDILVHEASFQRPRRRTRAILAVLLTGGLLFIAYGTIRDVQQAETVGRPISVHKAVASQLQTAVKGEGLISLGAILRSYPRQVPFLEGQTIIDMLLLPVPRLFWPDKPDWYGIDNITRRMGWPESTQTPVTMPGELFANFGWVGLLLMPGFGALFGLIYRLRARPTWFFCYAVGGVQIIQVTHWMSFTGFVNSLIAFPVMALVARVTLVHGPSLYPSTSARTVPTDPGPRGQTHSRPRRYKLPISSSNP